MDVSKKVTEMRCSVTDKEDEELRVKDDDMMVGEENG